MTNWKMPEWMRETWDAIGWNAGITTAIMNSGDNDLRKRRDCNLLRGNQPGTQFLIRFVRSIRKHRLLFTPAERDEREKRIADLEAKLAEVCERDNTRVDLEVELHRANDKNKALEAEVDGLRVRLHLGRRYSTEGGLR
jgi:hypothetical protein